MTNGAMFGVVSAIMKNVVNNNYDIAIEMCNKIVAELEKRKGAKDENEASA